MSDFFVCFGGRPVFFVHEAVATPDAFTACRSGLLAPYRYVGREVSELL